MPLEALKTNCACPPRTTMRTWRALSSSIRSPTVLAGSGRAAEASRCRVTGSALPEVGSPSTFWKAYTAWVVSLSNRPLMLGPTK